VIIDFHTHIFPDRIIKNRGDFLNDPSFSILYSSEKSRLADAGVLIDYIDENSLRGAVAMSFPWSDESLCRMHNEYMCDSLKDGKGKIFPFGMVPRGDIGSVRKVAGEIKSSGLYGIGEIAFYDTGLDRDGERFLQEVFESATEFSLPVCIHLNEPVGHMYPGKYEPDLAAFYRLISRFRECRIILSHWGGGMVFYELMPEVREALSNVWYDTAATPYIYSSTVYSSSLAIIPPEKILFGSDYPLLGVKRYIDDIRINSGSEEAFRMIAGGNAALLLGLDADGISVPDN